MGQPLYEENVILHCRYRAHILHGHVYLMHFFIAEVFGFYAYYMHVLRARNIICSRIATHVHVHYTHLGFVHVVLYISRTHTRTKLM